MKTQLLFTVAACGVLFTACDKKPSAEAGKASGGAPAVAADPKAAFKSACDAIASKVTAATADLKSGKTKEGLAAMTAIASSLGTVPVEGLPADLKTAFQSFTKSVEEMIGVMKDIPEGLPSDPSKMEEYMKTAGPEVMQKLMAMGPKMEALKPKHDEAKAALETAAKAAGIDLTVFLKAGD